MAVGIVIAVFGGVAVCRAVTGIGGTGDAFALAHKGGAHIGMELAVAGEAFKAFTVVKFFFGTGVFHAAVGVGATGGEGAGGKFFVFPAGGIYIFLVTADFFGCGFGHAVSILFFREVGIEFLLKIIVEAAFSGAFVLCYNFAVGIVHGAYALARAERCRKHNGEYEPVFHADWYETVYLVVVNWSSLLVVFYQNIGGVGMPLCLQMAQNALK